MKLIIHAFQQSKKDLFIALFQILKNCTSTITIVFEQERLYIQGMDKSQVCMFDIAFLKNWFCEYELTSSSKEDTILNIDSTIFYNVISLAIGNSTLDINYDLKDPDKLSIKIFSEEKGFFDKDFLIPLIDFDYEFLAVPSVDYDAEFSLEAKKMCSLISQFIIFGENVRFICSSEAIQLKTEGLSGEMKINIDTNDLKDYAIVEDEVIENSYSLQTISKMCLSSKLTPDLNFFISGGLPLKINYSLENESYINFFIAPKVEN